MYSKEFRFLEEYAKVSLAVAIGVSLSSKRETGNLVFKKT
jgi:hypothetical protein